MQQMPTQGLGTGASGVVDSLLIGDSGAVTLYS